MLTPRQRFALHAATVGWLARYPRIEEDSSRGFHDQVNWDWNFRDALADYDCRHRRARRTKP